MSLAQLFLLYALMTVVVHSFVADSSLLDSCDLVGFVCLLVYFLLLFFSPPFVYGLFLSWPFLPLAFVLDFLSLPC